MFIQDTNGDYIPLSRIKRIRSLGEKQGYELRLADETLTAPSFAVDAVIYSAVSTFPAHPGTYVLGDIYNPDGPLKIYRTLVLGWAITAAGDALPVTVNGIDDGTLDYDAIQLPDGSVTRVGDRDWAAVESYLSDRKASLAPGN